MGTPIIDDELRALIEPLLPPPKPRPKEYPGRRPVSDRAPLNCILFVFKTGIRRCDQSIKLEFGSGPTCWRRLRDWQRAGVWDRRHEPLLAKLREDGQLDFSRAASIHRLCDPLGRAKTGPNPKDRSRPGFRHHILVDANDLPVSDAFLDFFEFDVCRIKER
ncbi:Putative transposase of IS4/5 family [Burkholderia sp. GAS332]|nr:Putative transposase of IS4/5 family [Burkholderia sp. GAS332]